MAKYGSHIEAFSHDELSQLIGESEKVEFRGLSLTRDVEVEGYIRVSEESGEYCLVSPVSYLLFDRYGFYRPMREGSFLRWWRREEEPIFRLPPPYLLYSNIKDAIESADGDALLVARHLRTRLTDDELGQALLCVRQGERFEQERWGQEFLEAAISIALYGVEPRMLLVEAVDSWLLGRSGSGEGSI